MGTVEYDGLRERDTARRARLTVLLAVGRVVDADDHYHAAMLLLAEET